MGAERMWAQLASTFLGLWLMAAPTVLHYGGPAATVDRVFGPLAASFAFIALHQITRSLRWLNLPLGIGLALTPWVFGYRSTPQLNSIVVGILLAALSFVRGSMTERFGGGWAGLFRDAEPGEGRG